MAIPARLRLLKPARIEHDEQGRSLRDLLAAGEIDALRDRSAPCPTLTSCRYSPIRDRSSAPISARHISFRSCISS